MSDVFDVLQMLDEENPSSFSDLPDGGYWVRLTQDEGTRDLGEPDSGGAPRYMLGWRVIGGDRAGAACNDNLRWCSDDEDKQKTYRGITTGVIKAILPHVDESQHSIIAEGITALLGATEWQEAADAFDTITEGFGEVEMPIRLATKGEYQNTRYTDKGGVPCDVEDPREIEAVSV